MAAPRTCPSASNWRSTSSTCRRAVEMMDASRPSPSPSSRRPFEAPCRVHPRGARRRRHVLARKGALGEESEEGTWCAC
eukprot:scaffold30917_cov38-Tisochrysis_lutea.AAC.1